MDLPIDVLVKSANKALALYPDAQVFFKWTCGKCDSRQTFEKPNTLHSSGICEECGYETRIIAGGYDFVISVPKIAVVE